jgi:hypothetical protein
LGRGVLASCDPCDCSAAADRAWTASARSTISPALYNRALQSARRPRRHLSRRHWRRQRPGRGGPGRRGRRTGHGRAAAEGRELLRVGHRGKCVGVFVHGWHAHAWVGVARVLTGVQMAHGRAMSGRASLRVSRCHRQAARWTACRPRGPRCGLWRITAAAESRLCIGSSVPRQWGGSVPHAGRPYPRLRWLPGCLLAACAG